eukprot:TRINITY_DN81829_c0_g1_i1.p1 TRINITY_DN81829_c0_g1~~TRINITY_DN81829_c0_g1_i1.p1  ORF type:complete len:341 (-),score=77.69 TRINITY_DN81829_c0_g1_i1:38-985(-)
MQVMAFPSFQKLIPNGDSVVFDGKPWPAVGHVNRFGGDSPRNSFGLAFQAAGNVWTLELCQADSDGDGRSNGEELGDPNCNWRPGGPPPERSADLSAAFFAPPSLPSGSLEPHAAEAEVGLLGTPVWYGWHAIPMLSSWIIIIPLGSLFPVFKDRVTAPMWFHLHRSFMAVGSVLFLIGFVVAWVNQPGHHFHSAHGCLGFAAVVLGVGQIVLGVLRPPKIDRMSARRWVWELSHLWLGRIAVLLAAASALLGIVEKLGPFVSHAGSTAGAAVVGVIIGLWAVASLAGKLLSKTPSGKKDEVEDMDSSDATSSTD